jgi:hypothetical protein
VEKRIVITIIAILSVQILSAQIHFSDVTDSAGIDHKFQVFEGMFGGGVCVFDGNKDGFEDLYITGGMNSDQLLKNNGNGTFINIFEGSGLEITRNYVTQGVVSADVNKDGYRDLFITTITTREKQIIPRAENLLFLGMGNFKYKDATKEYGLDRVQSFSTGANFGDINGDGFPDLYVGNYFNQYDGKLSTISDATVVGANQISEGNLFINQKGRSFKDEYKSYGLDFKGFGFGGVFTDFDNDRDLDLIVNHDFGYKRTPNYFLQNNFPKNSFSNLAKEMAMDLKINSMGTAVGDYDNDGDMDYYFTNIRFNRFMENQGKGMPFIDRLKDLGMTFISISWGANFADFDHDGDLDLFVANGDLNPNCVPMANFYFENQNGKFEDLARNVGLGDYGISRGSVVFDMDNDGDLDILVVNQIATLENYPVESKTRLFRNDNGGRGNWLKIKLNGIQSDKNGLGVRLEIEADGKKMIREVDGGGSSHLSQNSSIVHFGLASVDKIDKINVYWNKDKVQTLLNIPVNQEIEIIETAEEPTLMWKWLIPLLVIAIFSYLAINEIRKKRQSVKRGGLIN